MDFFFWVLLILNLGSKVVRFKWWTQDLDQVFRNLIKSATKLVYYGCFSVNLQSEVLIYQDVDHQNHPIVVANAANGYC